MSCCQCNEEFTPSAQECVVGKQECADSLLHRSLEGDLDLPFGAGFQHVDLQPERPRRLANLLYLGCRDRIGRIPRKAITVALGTSSCSSSSRFGPSANDSRLTPTMLPPGRFKLATRPSLTGSLPVWKTIGIVEVAAFAARAGAEVPPAAITATRRRTRSAASAGN